MAHTERIRDDVGAVIGLAHVATPLTPDELQAVTGVFRAARARAEGTSFQPWHECVVTDCDIYMPPNRLMCQNHWRKVPEEQRRQLEATYRHGQTATTASDEYLTAVHNAIVAVQEGKR